MSVRIVPWQIEDPCGKAPFCLKPLKVRDRIALSEQLAEQRAKDAADNARLVNMTALQSVEHVAQARRDGQTMSALVLSCYEIKGALRVLAASCGGEEAIRMADSVDAKAVTIAACEALGIDMEAVQENAGKE